MTKPFIPSSWNLQQQIKSAMDKFEATRKREHEFAPSRQDADRCAYCGKKRLEGRHIV